MAPIQNINWEPKVYAGLTQKKIEITNPWGYIDPQPSLNDDSDYSDFNCGGKDDTSVCLELLMVLDAHGLQQLVQSSTRTIDKCRSWLDLVICSSSSTHVSQVAVHHRTSCLIMTCSRGHCWH